MTIWLVLTRSVHFGACLILFGMCFFDRFTASSVTGSRIYANLRDRISLISWVLLPLIFVSGIAWFALVAMTMSGQPLDTGILNIVWTQTQFGAVWKLRLAFLAVTVVLSFFQRSPAPVREFAVWVQTLASACLLGSLAWAGHGQETSRWHLLADVLHLLAAGIWPAGLLPLFLLLRAARRIAGPEDWLSVSVLVNRFSAISLTTVSLLALTGAVNAWFLVGSFSNFVEHPYGRWLLAKMTMFCAVLVVAGFNLLWLKPRLVASRGQPDQANATVAQLQKNVQFELALGSGIIAIVAVLGVLPPAIQ
ncbi:MAG TPA: CopD family protein [Verrucomicrobiae bacterium]|jgi:putative copper resistance protein D|nr:CopD family protein [Verrucomicrobiae bacterium]